MKLHIPPPPKLDGRIVMIPVTGWSEGINPNVILEANRSEKYIKSQANETIWFNLSKGMEWRVALEHDSVYKDRHCPICGTLLVKTETDGLWCPRKCYPSEYELWLALQHEVLMEGSVLQLNDKGEWVWITK